MKQVFKHELGLEPIKVETGLDAKVVLASEQNDAFFVWIENTPTYHSAREFFVVGTGHYIPDNAIHRYSFQSGSLVLHVYETVVSDEP